MSSSFLSTLGARAFVGLCASALVRRPDEAILGFIGGTQFALPPRVFDMRRRRNYALPRHRVESLARLGFDDLPRDFVLVVHHDGHEREALVHLPPDCASRRALPVVFNFHGFTSDAQEHSEYTQMNRAGAAHGVAVVHPQGLHSLMGYRAWNAGRFFDRAMERSVDDVGFVRLLMEQLASLWPVRDWFATGISNGGMLAYRLVHALPGRFSAIAPVAAVDLSDDPIPVQRLGVFHVHGKKDGLLPYQERPFRVGSLIGGFGWTRSARQSLLRFAHKTGATPEVLRVDGRRYEVWRGAGDVTVQLVVHGGGHTWLGDSFRIDPRHQATVAAGSVEILRFLLAHERR